MRKYILITSHRRENINNGFQEALCKSIFEILQEKNKRNSENELISNAEETVEFIVCLHTNPQARENFLKLSAKLLSMNISGINLLESVTYSGFIQLMQNALFIITDSGGVQEEAAYLSKYTLVMREEAEREEYLEQGDRNYEENGQLEVGTFKFNFAKAIEKLTIAYFDTESNNTTGVFGGVLGTDGLLVNGDNPIPSGSNSNIKYQTWSNVTYITLKLGKDTNGTGDGVDFQMSVPEPTSMASFALVGIAGGLGALRKRRTAGQG